MSMNLYVEATRAVTVNSTGEQSLQTNKFDLWQTATNDTTAMLQSGDPFTAYTRWVLERRRVEHIPQYDSEDRIIGRTTYCAADEHVTEFTEWYNTMLDEGYEVEFFEL